MNNFDLTEEQIKRYSRQIILSQIGGKGQKKLLSSSVLIVGTGGLGSPSGYYLAAAGVGRIGFVDFDVVDISNLQRQILHNTSRIGMPKTESAKETLKLLNPDVNVITHQERLGPKNIMGIINGYDLILEASDNFPTRYLLNDACVMSKKINISAAVLRLEGQITVFKPGDGPCYRCLYPEPPPAGAIPSCQEAGVLGVIPGILGVVQALEAIKIILGVGHPLIGRLLLLHGLSTNFKEVKIKKNPDCPICGTHPTIKELSLYEEVCRTR